MIEDFSERVTGRLQPALNFSCQSRHHCSMLHARFLTHTDHKKLFYLPFNSNESKYCSQIYTSLRNRKTEFLHNDSKTVTAASIVNSLECGWLFTVFISQFCQCFEFGSTVKRKATFSWKDWSKMLSSLSIE